MDENFLMNIDEKWMKIALNEANLAMNESEIPVGAVLVKNGKLIAQSHNQPVKTNDPTAHAEIIAITSAANTLNDWRLIDCALYVTKEPCSMLFV